MAWIQGTSRSGFPDSTTSDTWTIWIDSPTSNITSATGGTSDTWYGWVNSPTSSTTLTSATSNVVWYNWQVVTHEYQPQMQARQISHEEMAARQAELKQWQDEQQAAMKAAQERKEAADKRAMELLHENLSATQRKALKKHGWFLVEGGKSGKTYQIKGNKCAGNIAELDGKEIVARYCVHASYEIPLGDQLLAQAMSIRWDEEHLLSRANKTPVRRAA